MNVMGCPLYSYSLCAAIALMLFFGAYFILGKVPPKPIFDNYRRSRIIMGVAILLLAANYLVHLFVQPRFSMPQVAIFMNLSTYFLTGGLFGAALTSLLDKHYLTRRLFIKQIIQWVLFTMLGAAIFLLPEGTPRSVALVVLAGWFVIYVFGLARQLFRTYRRAVCAVDDFYSDNVAVYIRWMSIFTYWAIIFGIMLGVLTFLPEEYVFLWVLSSIPFYIYLFVSYMNYLLFCEQVQEVFDEERLSVEKQVEPQMEVVDDSEMAHTPIPACYSELADRLNGWIAERGYTASSITSAELAVAMETNRTYLTGYIKLKYGVSFRDWISSLRIEYAKELLATRSDLSVTKIANAVGYQSSTHFITLFSESEHISPKKWQKREVK